MCVGWRIDGTGYSDWRVCLNGHRLYDLDKGGVIHSKDFFEAVIQPTLPTPQSYTAYLNESPERQGLLEAAASALDTRHGGLYIGMKDCVRSMMCTRDRGHASSGGMCVACTSLANNKWFKTRIMSVPSVDALNIKINFDLMTRTELTARLNQRYKQAQASYLREYRAKQSAKTLKEVTAAAQERTALALNEVHTLLLSFREASEAMTKSERATAEAQVALACTVQEQAMQQASAEESLQAMVLATAVMQEELEVERNKRLSVEASAGATLWAAKEAHANSLANLATTNQQQMEMCIDSLVSKLQHAHTATEAEVLRLQAAFDATLENMQAESESKRVQAEWVMEEHLRICQQVIADTEVKHAMEVAALRSAHTAAVAEAERTAMAMVDAEAAVHKEELRSFPPLIQKLIRAHKIGELEKHSSTTELLTDIASCLEGGTTRGRQLSPTSQAFYGLLLNNASPWAHKFVAGVLFGPHLRTSQKVRAAFESGVLEDGLKEGSFEGLKTHLAHYGLESTPGIISEDATTALRRLDAETLTSLGEQTPSGVFSAGIRLWGFDATNTANTKLIHSVNELKALVEAKTALANYVYVYTWVPILPHAPWFPFAIIATNNKFDNVSCLLPM